MATRDNGGDKPQQKRFGPMVILREGHKVVFVAAYVTNGVMSEPGIYVHQSYPPSTVGAEPKIGSQKPLGRTDIDDLMVKDDGKRWKALNAALDTALEEYGRVQNNGKDKPKASVGANGQSDRVALLNAIAEATKAGQHELAMTLSKSL